MNGLDPIIATTLATRIDSLLNAVSGSVGSTQPSTGAPQNVSTPVPSTGAGANQTGQAGNNQAPTSAATSLSNTALTLAAILRLDAALLAGTGPQQQTTLLQTPPSEASASAEQSAAAGAQTAAQSTEASLAEAALETPTTLLEAAAADGTANSGATALAAEAGTSADAATDLSAALSTAATTASAATLPTAGSDALSAALNNALQQTLGNSGLFYESHLAQWLSGERSSDSLQNEPQAQLGNNVNTATPATPGQSGPSPLADKLSESISNFFSASAGEANGASSPGAAAVAGAARSGLEQAGVPIHPDSVALVRQQLDLLATSHYQWNGQAWPGTKMSWEVERRDGEAGTAADGTQVWHTRISLELPQLGKVDAVLALSGSQLTARITASPESAPTLSNGSNEFRRRAAQAGIDLTSLQIRSATDTPEEVSTDLAPLADSAPTFTPSADTAVLLQAYARGGRR